MSAPVTVLGLGAMGSVMAEVLLRNGHPVTVWNRTASKADPLVAKGAARADSAADAVAASDLVVISQIDYQAMYDSLGGDVPGLRGKVLVNLSADTPAELRRAAAWASAHGAELLAGGIMVPPPGIGRPGSCTFYSGSETALERHRDTLASLSEIVYVGADHGLAMIYYKALLNLFWTILTGYKQSAALLRSAGLAAKDLRPFVAKTLTDLAGDGPLGFVAFLTEQIDGGVSDDEGVLRVRVADMAQIVHAFQDAGIDTGVAEAYLDLFRRDLDSVLKAAEKP
ncbi:6-phosphogluconate dehydrogenase [Actinomadura sp. NBRC 104425]|uniref:imine reductase family protein n=1 Tax=Actinomadura sp. NBRC 104425 TaxID=3032204 RepID=UPI0024A0195E|nr:NAD(P)-binding domain-containing protein [Actinomadura sp. NBRC 104425]GLZ13632.1 6-phosphogluconate dehydrogenase [Actinomadura sp. NBRC 104425]